MVQKRLLGLVVLCVGLLSLCVSPVLGDPKPLSKEEQAKVDAAIDKGVAFLKKAQTKDGDWPRRYQGTHLTAQCALPAYSLLESGVPANDPVIQKAASYLREQCKKTCYTYDLSLAILFFDRLGDSKDKALIQSMALRLIAGQSRTGGWTYRCLPIKEKEEEAFLKTITELNRRIESGKSYAEALRDLNVPASFRLFTVFQDSRTFDWEEKGDFNLLTGGGVPFVGITDNSNTQFSILGLWAAQRHEVSIRATLRLVVERFERSQIPDGRWLYYGGYKGASSTSLYMAYRSMTCAGLMALAVAQGEKLSTAGNLSEQRADLPVYKGLTALYKQIGAPVGSMIRRVPHQDVYSLWSVERVAMLYNLPTIGDKDWYRWGAEILVTNQTKNGIWPGVAWRRNEVAVNPDYGPVLNTSFALLFLKHSHPMKDLTPKLPFSAKELNEGIARLQRGDNLTERPVAPSGPSKNRDHKPR